MGRPATSAARTERNGRQGVRYTCEEGMTVMDPETMQPVPWDGETMGEIMFRGNITMKGYLKNPKATDEAFAGGWFHSGDLAVMQPDGYIKIKDRSKDIIISGGENISSLEVEDVLYRHPAVLAAAVVAQPDPKWGETPCAFVELKPDATVTEDELIEHCRKLLARFKVPKTRGLRRAAEDLDRQDPEVRAARAGEVDERDRIVVRGAPPLRARCAAVPGRRGANRSSSGSRFAAATQHTSRRAQTTRLATTAPHRAQSRRLTAR